MVVKRPIENDLVIRERNPWMDGRWDILKRRCAVYRKVTKQSSSAGLNKIDLVVPSPTLQKNITLIERLVCLTSDSRPASSLSSDIYLVLSYRLEYSKDTEDSLWISIWNLMFNSGMSEERTAYMSNYASVYILLLSTACDLRQFTP